MSHWRMFQTSFGGLPKAGCAYRILDTNDGLEIGFIAKEPPFIIDLTQHNQFYEGLWRADCGELWLASSESDRYIEINLGPNGAWWTCVFSSARTRDLTCSPPLCTEIKSEILGEFWQASLVVSWPEIFRCLHQPCNF